MRTICGMAVALCFTGIAAAQEMKAEVYPLPVGTPIIVKNQVPIFNRNRSFSYGSLCKSGYTGNVRERETADGQMLAVYTAEGSPMDETCPSGVETIMDKNDLLRMRSEHARRLETEFLGQLRRKR